MSIGFIPGSRIHIVAIGGSGMSAIARILLKSGCSVSGSDTSDSTRLDALIAEGIDAYVGHDAAAMLRRSPDVIVHSSAIKPENSELVAARAAGLPVFDRASAVRELMDGRDVVEVMGTHGKTTTASMAAVAAMAAGIDVSYLVGSEIGQTGTNARWAGPVTIVEGDESDASGFELRPSTLIITNIDRDHMDFWPDQEDLIAKFEAFAATVGADGIEGVVIACADDEAAMRIAVAARQAGKAVITYGTSDAADIRLTEIRADGEVQVARVAGLVNLPDLRIALPGLHNLLNAGAVIALAYARGWSLPAVADSLAAFRSTRRRFEVMAEAGGVTVVDDYAHHPTAVAATIAGAQHIAAARRKSGQDARVVAVCQPYRWYRTAALAADYAQALAGADQVVLLDVYGPGEEPIPGAGADAIAAMVAAPCEYVGSNDRAVDWVLEHRQPGDVVLTLGGEDIRQVARALGEALTSADSSGRTFR